MARELPPFQSFANQLIISTQNGGGRFFDKSVLLITKHTSEEGAEGYIINRPFLSLPLKEIFQQRDVSALGDNFHLMCGGPVNLKYGIVLHTDDYKTPETQFFDNHLALTETQQILDDIVEHKGPNNFLILVGKAVWEAGQLEEEFMANMWISIPFSFDLLFKTEDDKKWQEALATLNIDANLLAHKAGKA